MPMRTNCLRCWLMNRTLLRMLHSCASRITIAKMLHVPFFHSSLLDARERNEWNDSKLNSFIYVINVIVRIFRIVRGIATGCLCTTTDEILHSFCDFSSSVKYSWTHRNCCYLLFTYTCPTSWSHSNARSLLMENVSFLHFFPIDSHSTEKSSDGFLAAN